MFNASNTRHFTEIARFTFQVPKTGTRFALNLKPVVEGEMRGLQVTAASDLPFPAGAKIDPGIGAPFRPGDAESVIYKGGNGATFIDVDGEDYDLFKVVLVDPGKDGASYNGTSGAVIYFKAASAIPPELGGEGILQEDPYRGFESG